MRVLQLAPILALAPALALAYPKAPCDEQDAERGTVEEWQMGLSKDGAAVAVLSTFSPENLVCASGQTDAVVREVLTGNDLWTGRYSSVSTYGQNLPSLEQGFPAPVISKYELAAPRRAEVKVLHPEQQIAPDRLVSGVGQDGQRFEIVLPRVPDTLQAAFIAQGRVALVFEVNKGTRRGNVTTQAVVLIPIRPQSSPTAYEALRARVRAASDPPTALELIAKEAYRDAENPFAAAALVDQIAPPLQAGQSPEAYLAAAGDLTLYLSKMKEPGAEGCVDLAKDVLENPALKAPALAKLRKAVEHNLGLCKRYVHPPPK